MHYNLAKFPIGQNDKQLKDENGKDATYRETLMQAISADIDSEGQPIRGQKKFIRYAIWKKLKAASGNIFLTAEEVALLTECATLFPVIVAGQVKDYLENPEKSPEDALPAAS